MPHEQTISPFHDAATWQRKHWKRTNTPIDSYQQNRQSSQMPLNFQFWKRLMKEYLPTLRPQSKWYTTKDAIKCGQVVWILENNSPRRLRPLGLVTEVFPGSDNIVRKCKLKTKTAHQLCLLEWNESL